MSLDDKWADNAVFHGFIMPMIVCTVVVGALIFIGFSIQGSRLEKSLSEVEVKADEELAKRIHYAKSEHGQCFRWFDDINEAEQIDCAIMGRR